MRNLPQYGNVSQKTFSLANKASAGFTETLQFQQNGAYFAVCNIKVKESITLVYDDSPVKVASFKAMNQYFGRRHVGRHGDIMDVAESEQVHFVLL